MILNRTGPQIDEALWLKAPDAASPGVGSNAAESQQPMLFGINHVRTKYDSNVRRGAIVKAMAFFSRYHFIEVRVFMLYMLRSGDLIGHCGVSCAEF